MSGIYVHIPFCKKKCIYCNFYSSTLLKFKDDYINALIREIELQKNFLDTTFDTIYIGGGTPSILNIEDWEIIIQKIYATFEIDKDVELTIEVNPDNINKDYVKGLIDIGFNRVSIGIQSFDDADLLLLKRSHNGGIAKQALLTIKDTGITNISADIIYGIPYSSIEKLENNIRILTELEIPHISAYSLSVEENTLLAKQINNKSISLNDEDQLHKQYLKVCDMLKQHNYLHYEISNFCKPNYMSKHNSNYWKAIPYLGLGASAHSYNIDNRYWNVDNLNDYIKSLADDKLPQTQERLTDRDKYNEFVMISLRTLAGIDTEILNKKFGKDLADKLKRDVEKYIVGGSMLSENNFIRIAEPALFYSDMIIASLFMLE